MTDTLPWPEPAAAAWSAVSVADFVALVTAGEKPTGRPRVVAIDGRGAGGKSTLAALLHAAVTLSVVVHTDDIAWHETFFGWVDLLRDGVLLPLRRGAAVGYTPPAWTARGRSGSIDIGAGLEMVIVEGVGAAQRAVADMIDVVVWVQSDFAEAERRGIARDVEQGVNGDPVETVAFWHEWMSAELPFVANERPWERADLIVAGTPSGPPAKGQVVIAPGPLLSVVADPNSEIQ